MKLLLVQWVDEAAAARAAELRMAGWEVEVETRDGQEAYRKARQGKPDVVVLDLAHKPSHSWQTARPLARSKSGPALVFVDGDEEARRRAREQAPGAVFTSSRTLVETLTALPERT